MKSFDIAHSFRIAFRLFLAGAVCFFAPEFHALPDSAPVAKTAVTPAAAKGKTKSSAVKAATGQTVNGSAGVKYSFKLPVGLTLGTPAREKADNFTEFTAATLSAGAAGGENGRPFRFEARIATFDKPVDCAIFTQFSEGLTRTFMGERYLDQSPAALQKVAGAAFRVKLFHKDVPPDHNQKSAAVNVAHYLTTQGDAILSLVFYTDARDEAKGQALRDAVLKSLRFGSSTGNAVCKSTPRSAVAPASSPAPSAAKPASSPK